MAISVELGKGEDMRPGNFRGPELRSVGIAVRGASIITAILAACLGSAIAQTAKLTDGQILAYVQTVNEGEVGDAKLALKRTKRDEVKAFAKHMQEDHSKSETVLADLVKKAKIKLAESEASIALKNKAGAGDKELEAVKDTDFDKQYARAQAKMHAEVATILQSQLMPAATSEAVKSALSETLSTVQEHQRMAEDLVGRL
jgi:putative membrane protein